MSAPKKLRVLSIAHAAVSQDAGRLRYYPLAERGDIELHLLVPQRWRQFGRQLDADPANDPNIHVHIQPIRFPHAPLVSWYLHYYPGMRRLIADIKPDVVHLWEEPWSVVAAQAFALRGDAGYILEVDQNILKRLPFPFEGMRRRLLRGTDFILSRSDEATNVVRACGYTGPVSLIAYGVNQSIFKADDQRDRASQCAAVKSGRLRLGYSGRLVVEKGLDDILDALVFTQEGVTLSIQGEGDHKDALQARVAQLGLSHRVAFQPWGSASDVAEFLRGLDISLLLTRTTPVVREQFGRAILEAQICGAPVIGSTCGAIPDVTGAGGWIIPESAPKALAACLWDILARPEQLQVRAEAGIANVQSRFTYDIIGQTLANSFFAADALRKNCSGA